MIKRSLLAIIGLVAVLLPAALLSTAAGAEANAVTYQIEFVNNATGQWFTPPNVALHSNAASVFDLRSPASPGVQAVAENGGVAVLAEELAGAVDATGNGVSGVLMRDGTDENGPLAPGTTASGEFTTSESKFSLVSMIICTNDGFAGADSKRLPRVDGEEVIYTLRGYDAGTEINTENRADIVGAPFCGDGDGTDQTNPSLAEDGVVRVHRTLQNTGNLDPALDWDNNEDIAYVRITRVGDTDAPMAAAPPAVEGMVFTESSQSFDATLAAITGAIEANPALGIVGTVDHKANAERVGLELDPNSVIIFGNPNIGTPLMNTNRLVGIDLPQRIQVIETGGQVFVGFNDASFLADRYDLGSLPQLDVVAGALRALTGAGTGPDQAMTATSSESYIGNSELTTVESDADFETTWNRLIGAIEASPAGIFTIVDHAENAANASLELAPTRLVLFGNPNIGTPLMVESPTSGFDLPLRILVWEDADGSVMVTANTLDLYTDRHGIVDTDLTTVNGALNNFVAAASVTPDPPDGDDTPTYAIRFVNNTTGQYFTPPNVALHSNAASVFSLRSPASPGVQAVAENGGVAVLAEELAAAVDATGNGVSGVLMRDGTDENGALMPGATASGEFSTNERKISVVSMIICTNDGFAGADSKRLPRAVGETITYNLRGYDAGTEINTESRDDIVPAPFCGDDGRGTDQTDPSLAEDGVVRVHRTLQGTGDLDAQFDWDNNDDIAYIEIIRLD